jgi:uncharacterized membrane protein (DUF4010 family)
MPLHNRLNKLRHGPSPNSRRHSRIWAEKDKVKGITAAASLWVTAAIGLTTGIGDFSLAITVMLLVFIILSSKYLLKKIGIP